MDKKLTIDVCVSPYLYPVHHKDDAIVVIIDILRATSAICTAFHYGVEKMIPVATLEEAVEYKKQGFMVGAERNGITVDGFDFGNSPYSYMTDAIKGKTVVLSTTNGTQAIEAARNAQQVIIGAFTNISALCNYLIAQKKSVLLVCSGWKNQFNWEDSIFAGAVTSRLLQAGIHRTNDAARAMCFLYEQSQKNQTKFLRNSSHAARLAEMGLKKDIKYCFQLDQTTVIPVLQGKYLVKLSE